MTTHKKISVVKIIYIHVYCVELSSKSATKSNSWVSHNGVESKVQDANQSKNSKVQKKNVFLRF